ncbi:hypothetical protein HYC85_027838 [Camellia sinensis]|uniref:Uncharacterized protein n=1 Tax=Camellia sinensis TaxID=4442 RepID=A0A7J7FU82_CAMSI|nr:hypothetical protein HYC85_027838 [Camellia sinensis]
MSANGGLGVHTIWKVPIRSMESRLGAAAEERVKTMKEWREREKAKWDELVQPSALFEAGLGPQPRGGDLDQAELEARREVQEAENQAILAKATKLKETRRDRPPQPITRERIRPRPKPLGGKDLSSFEPRPPPVDPVKEHARKEGEALKKKKKKKKKRSAPEGAADEPGAKRAEVAPAEVEVPVAKGTPEVVEVTPTREVVETAPTVQVGVGLTEVAPSGREQTQKGPAPQEGGVRLATAIYHARAVAGRLEGEEGPARAGADRLVKIVEETALRSASRFNEVDLLRGLCSAQMEESADWKTAHAELQAVKLELEDTRRKVVSLEFQLAGEQKKLEESERACAVAIEWHEEAMSSNEELVRQKDKADARIGDLLKELEDGRVEAEEEKWRLVRELETEKAKVMAEIESLRKGMEEERATAAAERGALQRELDEERAKAASERAAYPDLCIAAVEQYKGSPEFQIAVDAAVARNLAGQESRGVGPSRTTAGGRTEAEVIESFQQSDFYKHEMAEFWDSSWKMFKRGAEELFPDLDLSSVTIGEDDVAQTPLDEGIEEEERVSSEEE